MAVNKLFYTGKFSTICLFLTLLTLGLTTPVRSEYGAERTNLPEFIVFRGNFDPPGDPEPKGGTSGAGSRDGSRCSSSEKPIKSLMPERNFGLTFKERPPVFIYLPKTSAKKALLIFRDEVGKYYERALLPITNSGGIISFNLPQEKPPLSLGKNYQWSLVVICGNNVQPDDPTFHGWVQRVAINSKIDSELINQTPIWRAKWYAERGYWYEMLMSMDEATKAGSKSTQLTALLQKFWRSMGVDI